MRSTSNVCGQFIVKKQICVIAESSQDATAMEFLRLKKWG
jgi:hypothetical protein